MNQKYAVGRLLGQGRFGQAFAARRLSDGVEVCIKRVPLRGKGLPDAVHQKYIENELSMLRAMQTCPVVVRLLDVQSGPDAVEIVMELAAAGTLADWQATQPGGQLREAQAAAVLAQVLRALAACHSKGIAFADLKPANVLMRSVPEPGDVASTPLIALADFGCSQKILSGGQPRRSPGTPLFAAPEVWRHRGTGMEADIWAAGVLLYHMLCGGPQFPFFTTASPLSPAEAYRHISSGDINFSSPVWAKTSPGARVLVERMLERDPESRITAREALESAWLREHTIN